MQDPAEKIAALEKDVALLEDGVALLEAALYEQLKINKAFVEFNLQVAKHMSELTDTVAALTGQKAPELKQ